MITNGVLVNLVRGATNALGIGPHDRMPMSAPHLAGGGGLPDVPPAPERRDARHPGRAHGRVGAVPGFLATERITLAYMAPTVVRFLVDAIGDTTFPDLRMIALGGELVDADVVALTRDLLGPDLLANGFGTAGTGVITLHVLEAPVDAGCTVPAGHPGAEVDVLILDEHGDPQPPGTSGEIAISTPHAPGLLGPPRKLTEVVLAQTRPVRPGWRLYRTGDLGVLDGSGPSPCWAAWTRRSRSTAASWSWVTWRRRSMPSRRWAMPRS